MNQQSSILIAEDEAPALIISVIPREFGLAFTLSFVISASRQEGASV
jgi:hypothetical protein